MSLNATLWAWSQQDLSPSEKLTLLSLADRAGESHEAWPSWSRLIFDTGLNRKTIYKVLASLQEKGLIAKTGDKIKLVHVYKLIGIKGRDELSTDSTKNGTGKKQTSTKNGTTTSTKNGTTTSTKNGTQNLSVNLQRNLSGADAQKLSFFNIKTETQNRLEAKGLPYTDDLIEQIEYYAIQSSDIREPTETIDIAIALHAKKQFKIPNGYKGITAKSIAEKELREERDRKEQFQQDASIMRGIRSKAMELSMNEIKNTLQ